MVMHVGTSLRVYDGLCRITLATWGQALSMPQCHLKLYYMCPEIICAYAYYNIILETADKSPEDHSM